MEGYVRFSNTSPIPSRAASYADYSHDDEDTDSTPSPQLAPLAEEQGRSWLAGPRRLWQEWRAWLNAPPATPYESQYLTLIPLSDARLRPRRTKLIVSSLLLLAVLAAVGVFLLVPRGVSVGSINVHSTRMTFNATTLTYRIILQADVPVYNPNYLKATITGNVTVAFFDAAAGWSAVGPVSLAGRINPAKLSVKLDASNLPRKYTQVVYTHCFNFPRKLIFFLLATFKASYLGYETHLPKIDTYFILDCSGAKQKNALQPPLTAARLGDAAAAAAEAAAQQQQHAALLRSTPPGLGWQQQQQEQQQVAQLPDWELEVDGVVSLADALQLQQRQLQLLGAAGLPGSSWPAADEAPLLPSMPP